MIPGWRRSQRSPGEGNGNPLQYSFLENPMERSLEGYSPEGCYQSDMTEQLGWHAGYLSIFLSLCTCLLWTFHMSGIIICSFFFLVSLSIIDSGFIHLVASLLHSFLRLNNTSLFRYTTLLIYWITVALHCFISVCSSAK